jgi:ABC-2 type transport system permease protein
LSLLPAGSTPWLLAHELRLAWRGMNNRSRPGKDGKPRNGRNRGLILALVLVAVAGMGVFAFLPSLHRFSRLHVEPTGWIVLGVSGGMLFLFSLMMAQALNGATVALYERNDLDLLLSSPIAPRTILTVRALGVAVMAGLTYMLLASLFVVPLAVFGQVQWLAVYVVIAALALVAASAGLALAMGLFALIGPRRTRVVAQVLAALIGASLFLAGQARNILPKETLKAIVARVEAIDPGQVDLHAAYTWPARAVLGEPLPLAVIASVALLIFIVVTSALGRRFGEDAAAAAGSGASSRAQAKAAKAATKVRARFGGGPFEVLFRKELRLLLRDPWLISQVLLQVIYILPLGFTLWRTGHASGEVAMAAGASAICFIAGQLAGNLTWITASAEDAPELIASAPASMTAVVWAKVLAAMVPSLVITAPAVAAMAVISVRVAGIAALGAAGSMACSALLNLWYAKPGNRRDFRRRRSGSILIGLVETLLLFACAGATWFALTGLYLVSVGLAVAIGAVLVVMRRPLKLSPFETA